MPHKLTRVYNSIAQLRYHRLFQARYILHLQECGAAIPYFIMPQVIMQLFRQSTYAFFNFSFRLFQTLFAGIVNISS